MPANRPRDLVRTIGFLDIETSDFKADIGYMLSWCIKGLDTKKDNIQYDVIKQKEVLNGSFDKRITSSLLEEMEKYDVLVTYYGTGFDIPFVRTRAVINGHEFPLDYGSNVHFDVYYVIRNKFKIRRNSLKIACEQLLGKTNKTDVNINVWKRARLGHQESLDYVLEHNKYDVIDTEALYKLAVNYRRNLNTSV
jgi:uncharacterized protein YprB with RNaseH-like and TPR domain